MIENKQGEQGYPVDNFGQQEQHPPMPPPAYQDQPYPVAGQTYYQPPPIQGDYEPAALPQESPNRSRIARFYAPHNNGPLAWKRRTCSMLCCCILIGLIVGLAASLTHRNVSGFGIKSVPGSNMGGVGGAGNPANPGIPSSPGSPSIAGSPGSPGNPGSAGSPGSVTSMAHGH